MNGTLRRIEKELRNIAKRYKNIKYSKSLLLSFLVTGAFSYGNEENFLYNDINIEKNIHKCYTVHIEDCENNKERMRHEESADDWH